ncbi:MAG: adenylate/guanylate cyclase protein [Burkholderiaceae bacterium]|nr:adenylate/guanylate cyclase protein [Burkholderiaceae bacterium]
MGSLGLHTRRNQLRLAIALTAALLVILFGTHAWQPSWYQQAELLTRDWNNNLHLRSDTREQRIVIVDIDEASIDAVGTWPWPRQFTAKLSQNLLQKYQARAVGLDIVFPEPADAPGDIALAEVARHHPLVFAQAFDFSNGQSPPRAGELGRATTNGMSATSALPRADGYIGNHPLLAQAGCVGHITPKPDPDGQVRRIAPLIAYGEAAYPMLAIAMLECASGNNPEPPGIFQTAAAMTQPDGFMRVPFKVGLHGFTVISARDILAENVPVSDIEGRYVLVGSSALGLGDRVSTPIHPWLPGVVVHAEILSAMLDEAAQPHQRYDVTPLAWGWALASIAVLALLFSRTRASVALGVLGLLAALWLAIADRIIQGQHEAPLMLPFVAYAVFLFIHAPLEWAIAQAESQRFINRFRKYLPPSMVDQLVKQRGEIDPLTAARKMLTVLFVDIEGYTTMAEEMPPEQLADITQRVLGNLTDKVHQSDGTLDKYMGDALMAFWGAPLTQDGHADLALDCAAAMLAGIGSLNAQLRKDYPALAPIHIRIGVNSGEAVVGELGTPLRRAYTAIGDTVNIASRLQEYAKQIGQELLIGETTAKLAKRHNLIALTTATLRGRSSSETIYTLAQK